MKTIPKNRILILFIIVLVAVVSCNKKDQNSPLYTLRKDGQKILHLDFRNVTDTITLKLSDIVEDVRFIQLETNDESMLSLPGLLLAQMNKGTILVGEKYIIVLEHSRGLFQFSIEGKFIRKIASPGRGPCEFGFPIYTIDETGNGKLLIADPTHPKSIMQFDLTTGECLESIPRVMSGFIDNLLTIDSLILCAPQIGPSDAGEFYLFSQSIDGNLISGIKHQIKQLNQNSGVDVLYRIQDRIYFRPDLYDTIFQYDQGKLKPALVIKTRNKKDNQLNERNEGNIQVSISTDTDFHTILTANEITKGVSNNATISGIEPVIIDKITNRAFKVNQIINDLFPYDYFPNRPYYGFIYPRILRSTPDNSLIYVFNGYEFKRMSTRIRNTNDTEIDPDIRNQIIQIDSTLTQYGNPIIMIAKAKKLKQKKH